MMSMIHARIAASDKEWLTKTVSASGQSLSEFIRMAAIKEAHRITSVRVRPVVRVKMGRINDSARAGER